MANKCLESMFDFLDKHMFVQYNVMERERMFWNVIITIWRDCYENKEYQKKKCNVEESCIINFRLYTSLFYYSFLPVF